jgi:hypothetical protein
MNVIVAFAVLFIMQKYRLIGLEIGS